MSGRDNYFIECFVPLQPYVSSSQSPPSSNPQPPAYPQNIPASYSPNSTPASRNNSMSPVSSTPYDLLSEFQVHPSWVQFYEEASYPGVGWDCDTPCCYVQGSLLMGSDLKAKTGGNPCHFIQVGILWWNLLYTMELITILLELDSWK